MAQQAIDTDRAIISGSKKPPYSELLLLMAFQYNRIFELKTYYELRRLQRY